MAVSSVRPAAAIEGERAAGAINSGPLAASSQLEPLRKLQVLIVVPGLLPVKRKPRQHRSGMDMKLPSLPIRRMTFSQSDAATCRAGSRR